MNIEADPFLQMLLDKMSQAGLPQAVLDLTAAQGARIERGYRPEVPEDIVLLNNKLIHLCELVEQSGLDHSADRVPSPLNEMIIALLRRKI